MGLGSYDDAIMSGPWAQWGRGFFSPYISPPLIRARFLGANQGTEGAKGLVENSNRQNWATKASINAFSKGVPLLAVCSAVIIARRFVNRSGMHVALNEGSLGFLPLHCGALRAPPINTPCCAFSSLLPHPLFKFSLYQAHILKAFSSPSLRSSSLLRASSKFLLLPSSSYFVFFPYYRNHNFRGHFLLNNGLFSSFVLRGFFGHIQGRVWCSQGCKYRLLSSGQYRNPKASWNQYSFLPSYVNP